MPSFNKFNQFIADVYNKVHNLGTNTLKIMLSNVAPLSTNTIRANLTEISSGSGYTAGGAIVPITSSSQVGGTYKLLPTGNVVFTSTTGIIGPFRYAILYNSAAVGDALIGWLDYGSSIQLNPGESFTVALDTINGIIQAS